MSMGPDVERPSASGGFASMDLGAFLSRVSSDEPTPGGGSVSALAGALGASLGEMVWRLTQVKCVEEWPEDEVSTHLVAVRELGAALTADVDRDAASYDAVIAAMRLPKGTDQERAARKEAIAAAVRGATEVPLETARLCARVMEVCLAAVREGFGGSVTDAGAGLLMGFAGLSGALYNVEINLGGLSDPEYVGSAEAEVAELRAGAAEMLARADEEIRRRMRG